jgi:hypothetical protein
VALAITIVRAMWFQKFKAECEAAGAYLRARTHPMKTHYAISHSAEGAEMSGKVGQLRLAKSVRIATSRSKDISS